MEISGKKLQSEMLPFLATRIAKLKKNGIIPTIAIVTLGHEETWKAYVGQKIKLAKKLGINYRLINLSPKSTDEVLKDIDLLNKDNTIHGLIVQRPFPTYIDTERIIQNISKYKDIDGFRDDSICQVPVWLAIMHIITYISQLINVTDQQIWLSNQSILVVGRGETAGLPVINGFKKMKIEPWVIDSKTTDTGKLYARSDIIIFATGKRLDVPYTQLKKNCILIGIGLHRNEDGLRGDFDENEVKEHVLYYTPSPGGVGPLNLYYLFDNLVNAAENA